MTLADGVAASAAAPFALLSVREARGRALGQVLDTPDPLAYPSLRHVAGQR
jgi:hypothetical protein